MAKITSEKNKKIYLKKINSILCEKLDFKRPNFLPMVEKFINQRKKILSLVKKHPTPFYLFDKSSLDESINDFKNSFKKFIPDLEYYYAVKVNHHPLILKNVIKNGFGLDVSSGRELKLALKFGAKKIIFTGPGKTEEELKLALQNYKKVIINIDSWGELNRLKKLLVVKPVPIFLGVRVYTKSQGEWSKFGTPLNELKIFWQKAKSLPGAKLIGIHFHSSWNQDAKPYQTIIKEISDYLVKNFTVKQRKEIKFIDFGGGFRPFKNEGFYPWETAAGEIIKSAADYYDQKPIYESPYYLTESIELKEYAIGIGLAINKYLRPIIDCKYFSEPGRIICNNSLHLILKIIDIKNPREAIADGGINLVGWERYEHDYFPTINLTRPAKKEIAFQIFGSLCMPQDQWGYYCFAKDVKENDIILIPNQGALTYSLAQEFIKPIAKTIKL